MPVNTVSAMMNTLVCFLATSIFISLCLPIVQTEVKAAAYTSARALLEGLKAQINSLSPGMHSTLVFQTSPWVALGVQFENHSLFVATGNGSLQANVRWQLPKFELENGCNYVLSLKGSILEIEKKSEC